MRSSALFCFRSIKLLIGLVLILVMSACRTEDGEQAFVDAVEIINLGVQSIAIQVDGQGTILEAGTESSLSAFATLEDSSLLDVTNRVSWSSSDSSIVTVNGSGQLSAGTNSGSAVIAANWGDLSASQSISVSTASLISLSYRSFTSSSSQCVPDRQLMVDGVYADRTSNVTELASWASSNSSVATVSSSGILATFDDGASTITATYGGQSVNGTITVAADISNLALSSTPAANFSLDTSATRSFSASVNELGIVRDVTDIASYESSDANVLTFSNNVASAGSQTGTSDVTVRCGDLATTPITVTVTVPATADDIEIRYNNTDTSPAGPFEVRDSPIQLSAILVFSDGSTLDVTDDADLDWSVNSTVSGTGATVDNGNSKGEVVFNAVGRTRIGIVFDSDDYPYFEDTIDVLVE